MILIAGAVGKRLLCYDVGGVERRMRGTGISIYLLTVKPQSQISAACRCESAPNLYYPVLAVKKRQGQQITRALVQSLHPFVLSKVAEQQSIMYEVASCVHLNFHDSF